MAVFPAAPWSAGLPPGGGVAVSLEISRRLQRLEKGAVAPLERRWLMNHSEGVVLILCDKPRLIRSEH